MPVWIICPQFVPPTQGPRILETGKDFLPDMTAIALPPLAHESLSLYTPVIAKPLRVLLCCLISDRWFRFHAGSRMPVLHPLKMRMTFLENRGRAPTVEDCLIGAPGQRPFWRQSALCDGLRD